eukprot:1268315-Lingulodinium_polyedra.AAC.1
MARWATSEFICGTGSHAVAGRAAPLASCRAGCSATAAAPRAPISAPWSRSGLRVRGSMQRP